MIQIGIATYFNKNMNNDNCLQFINFTTYIQNGRDA